MDREKVIKEFELFIKEFHPACTSEGIELDMFREVLALLKEQEDLGTELTNAVELIHKKNERIEKLLKEQEAVEPKKVKGYNPPMYTIYEYECEKCESPILNKQPFCMGCGRSVKWE